MPKQLGRLGLDHDDYVVKSVLSQLYVWSINMEIARTSVSLELQGKSSRRNYHCDQYCT